LRTRPGFPAGLRAFLKVRSALLPVPLVLLVLAATAGCGGSPKGRPFPATVWNPCRTTGNVAVAWGGLVRSRPAYLTRFFGRESPPAGAVRNPVLDDTRDALLVRTPTRFSVPLDPASAARSFHTGLRRLPPAPGNQEIPGPVRCEVFLQSGGETRALGSADLPPPEGPAGDPWVELQFDLPAEAHGSLEFITRYQSPALSDKHGPDVAWGVPVISQAAADEPPDVLLLTIDTLRADALKDAPRLRAILSRGTLWTRALAPSNWTLPSYASLFTDRDADAHGAGRGAFSPQPAGGTEDRGLRGIDSDLTTLAELFRRAGYATCMIHQNPFLEPWTGLDRGFERYVRTVDDTGAGLREAEAWWRSEPHRPRFLVLHLMAPHLPYEPPVVEGLSDSLPPDPLAKLDWRKFFLEDHTPKERAAFFDLSAAQKEAVKRRYRAEVAVLDAKAGPWLEKKLAADPSLLLAFHADHGEELWDEGSFEHGQSFAEAVVRVPVGIVWRGKVPARTEAGDVRARDLGPTLLELAGIPRPEDWRGSLFHPQGPLRCLHPFYRSQEGGLEISAPGGTARRLPFDTVRSAQAGSGPPFPPELRQALQELGY